MMRENPLISVIIPTYKRPISLERAIESVLDQTYFNIEILVVDDNNPNTKYREETITIMKKYINNKKIKYIKHPMNKNGAAARNTGIKNSNGKYITFLDDDDTYRKKKVEKQVEFLEATSDYEAVYCGWKKGTEKNLPKYEGDLTYYLLSGEALVITNSIMISRKSAVSIGGWNESFRRNQEAVFLISFFDAGYEIGAISEILFDMEPDESENASNAEQNEKNFNQYLKFHERQIEESSKKLGKDKDNIYSYRYRGVLLSYLKHRDFIGALKVYGKMIKKMPIRFNKDLCIYLVRKIQGKNIFS